MINNNKSELNYNLSLLQLLKKYKVNNNFYYNNSDEEDNSFHVNLFDAYRDNLYNDLKEFMKYSITNHNITKYLKLKLKVQKDKKPLRLLVYINFKLDTFLNLYYLTISCYKDTIIGQATKNIEGSYKFGTRKFIIEEDSLFSTTNKEVKLYELRESDLSLSLIELIKEMDIDINKISKEDIDEMYSRIKNVIPFVYGIKDNNGDEIFIKYNKNNLLSNSSNNLNYFEYKEDNLYRLYIINKLTGLEYQFKPILCNDDNLCKLESKNIMSDKTLIIPKWVSNKVNNNYWF